METRPKKEIVREVEGTRRQLARDLKHFKRHAVDKNAVVIAGHSIKRGWRDWMHRLGSAVRRVDRSVRKHPYRYAVSTLTGGALIGWLRFRPTPPVLEERPYAG